VLQELHDAMEKKHREGEEIERKRQEKLKKKKKPSLMLSRNLVVHAKVQNNLLASLKKFLKER